MSKIKTLAFPLVLSVVILINLFIVDVKLFQNRYWNPNSFLQITFNITNVCFPKRNIKKFDINLVISFVKCLYSCFYVSIFTMSVVERNVSFKHHFMLKTFVKFQGNKSFI